MIFLYRIGLLSPLSGLLEGFILLAGAIAAVILTARYYQDNSDVNWFDTKITDKELGFGKSLITYPLWALAQQAACVLLFVFFDWFMPGNYAVVVTVFLFALVAHYPNIILMLATLGMEAVLMLHFQEFRNIYIIALIHGWLGSALLFFYPMDMTRGFLVWKDFFDRFKEQK